MKYLLWFAALCLPCLLFAQPDSLPVVLILDQFPSDTTRMLLEEEPKPINMATYRKMFGYPENQLEEGMCTKVVFRVLVNSYGEYVAHTCLIPCAHAQYLQQMEQYLPMLRFTPGISGGKPVACWVNLPFNIDALW